MPAELFYMKLERSAGSEDPIAHVQDLRLYPERTGKLLKDFRQENQ